MVLLLICLTNILQLPLTSLNEISTEYITNNIENYPYFEISRISGALNIRFFQDDPSIFKYFNIDLTTNFNWASTHYYSLSKSKTAIILSNNNETFNQDNQIPIHIADTFYHGNLAITPFNFILYNGVFEDYDTMTLCYKPLYHNHSLVNVFYDNGRIQRRTFAIVMTVEPEGLMFFGGMPSYIVSKYKYNHTCNITKHIWGCALTKVKVGNDMYVNNDYSYFQTSDKRILVPKKFMAFLKEKYFDNYIKNNTCVFRGVMKYNYYFCLYNYTEYFPSISFYFDNVEILMNKDDLYFVVNTSQGDVYKHYLIEENVDDSNTWVFANAFFKRRPMLFDYDKSTVTIYYNESSVNDNSNNNTLQHINYINIIILSVGILNLCLNML